MTKNFVDLKNQYYQVPKTVRQFLNRALLFFILWKTIYSFILKPTAWLDNTLTQWTTKATIYFLQLFYLPNFRLVAQPNPIANCYNQNIYLNDRFILLIADPCNGLELFVLYIGFIVCITGKIAKKIKYCIGGVALIAVLNIARCFALSWLVINKNEWVNFAHHYAFTFIVYSVIFLLWVSYMKTETLHES